MACHMDGAKPLCEPMNIVYWTLRNKLQWNLDRNLYVFIQENAIENVVNKFAANCLGPNVLIDIESFGLELLTLSK